MVAFAALVLSALPCTAALRTPFVTAASSPWRTHKIVSALSEQEERVSAAMEIAPVKAESARSTGLALALDDGTRKSHSMAENTQFVTGFFRGIATRDSVNGTADGCAKFGDQ